MTSAQSVRIAGLLSVVLAMSAVADAPMLAPDEGIVLIEAQLSGLRQIQFWRWGEKSGFIAARECCWIAISQCCLA